MIHGKRQDNPLLKRNMNTFPFRAMKILKIFNYNIPKSKSHDVEATK